MKNSITCSRFVLLFLIFSMISAVWGGISHAVPMGMEGLPKPGEMILGSDKDIPKHVWIAGRYLKAGKFENVIIICERIIGEKPGHVKALAHLAAAYKGIGDEQNFNKASGRIKKIDPKSPALYLSLAGAYQAVNNTKAMEAVLKKGIKVSGDRADLQMELAGLYGRKGDIKKASDHYKRIIKENPGKPKYYLNANYALCRIGLKQKDFDGVIKRAEKVIVQYPPIDQTYLFLGTAYIGSGKPDSAIKAYEKLMKVNPKSPVSYQEIALILSEKKGKFDKAVFYAKKAVENFPKSAKSQDVLGWVYFKNETYDKAVEHFQAATGMDYNNPAYFYHLGLARQKTGDKAEAKKAFKIALGMVGPEAAGKFKKELETRIGQCE